MKIATGTEMSLNRRNQIIILSSLVGMATLVGIVEMVQARSKVYFPIDMETLVITKTTSNQDSIA